MTDDDSSTDGEDGLPGGMTYGDFLRVQLDGLLQQSGDHLLRVFVDVVNRGHLNFDVTLSVGGTLIAGDLVSGAVYFHEVAELVDAQAGEQGATLSMPFREVGNDYFADGMLATAFLESPSAGEAPVDPSGAESKHLPVYVHLRNAVVWHGASSTTVGFWRGRIAEVQGWTVGRVQAH